METPLDHHVSPATHTVANWLLGFIDNVVLSHLGLDRYSKLEDIVYLVIVIAGAFFIGYLLKKIIYFCLSKLVKMRHGDIGEELLDWKTLQKCSLIVPPIVVKAMAPFAFEASHRTLVIIERIAGVYALITLGIGLAAVFDFIFNHYNIHDNRKRPPVKGIVNVAKGVMWIVIVIIAVSVAVDRSPAMLLTGLGAFAAALMLIFKDSILGFVAGIQMSQNDMLHVGDWIVVPGTPANGNVLDMTLTAVKVQNWDNTIVTVPPYTLVSTSFQNYRGMYQAGCRRIVKTLTMDLTTVYAVDDAQVDAIVQRYPVLKSFVDGLRASKHTEQDDGGLTPINGTIDTNLGLFRAYACLYIFNNPMINNTQQIIVRLMDATPYGLPMEIYCFTATTDWDKYEAIQSAILEHLATACVDFGLAIYSSSTLTVSQENNTGAVPYDAGSAALPEIHNTTPPASPSKPSA